jgi:hypothetical protein
MGFRTCQCCSLQAKEIGFQNKSATTKKSGLRLYLVVQHTMQALPLRSMSNSTNWSYKTPIDSVFLRGGASLLLLMLLLCVALAQQSSLPQTCTQMPGKVSSEACPNIPVEACTSETLIDASLPEDRDLEQLLKPYTSKVRALEVTIGTLAGQLQKTGIGAGSMGNFVTDAMRSQASVKTGRPMMVAVTNGGGLRKSAILPGPLRARDIFELMPFENALIKLDFTGEDLLKILRVVVERQDAQSGAQIKYRQISEKKAELISASLLDPKRRKKRIDPRGTYTVVIPDYLSRLVSGSYSILQKGRNLRPLGITLRDAIIEYVKSETAAGRSIHPRWDGRFSLVGPDLAKPQESQK